MSVADFVKTQLKPAPGTAYPLAPIRKLYECRAGVRVNPARFAAELGRAGLEVIETVPSGVYVLGQTVV
jgi:hypothetical protein